MKEKIFVERVISWFKDKEWPENNLWCRKSIPLKGFPEPAKRVQFDVLAVNPEKELGIIVECKVRSGPYDIANAFGQVMMYRELLVRNDFIKICGLKHKIPKPKDMRLCLCFPNFDVPKKYKKDYKWMKWTKECRQLFEKLKEKTKEKKIGLLLVVFKGKEEELADPTKLEAGDLQIEPKIDPTN